MDIKIARINFTDVFLSTQALDSCLLQLHCLSTSNWIIAFYLLSVSIPVSRAFGRGLSRPLPLMANR